MMAIYHSENLYSQAAKDPSKRCGTSVNTGSELTRPDTAAAIKANLSMHQVAERYGFHPNKAGFIICPFHNEKTASCKIYDRHRGFYCHACHTGGSVIDFVMRLFEIPFREAIAKLNSDFGLGLSLDRSSRVEMSRLVKRRQEEARLREAQKKQELDLFDHQCQIEADMNRCEMAMEAHPPIRDKWNVIYPTEWVEAMKRWEQLRAELYNNDCEWYRYVGV